MEFKLPDMEVSNEWLPNELDFNSKPYVINAKRSIPSTLHRIPTSLFLALTQRSGFSKRTKRRKKRLTSVKGEGNKTRCKKNSGNVNEKFSSRCK